MTPEKIAAVAERYQRMFARKSIEPKRMDTKRTLGSLTPEQQLAHACFLVQMIPVYARDPEKIGKANRHLATVQTILSFRDMFTTDDLMSHNRPDES